MFDKFGEFGSAEELNATAEGLKAEGDIESLKILAVENGLDEMDALDYIEGVMPQFVSITTAALGKLTVEQNAIEAPELIGDWIDYIESEVMEDEEFAKAVRRKNKSLAACLGQILKYSVEHMYKIDRAIMKASGVASIKAPNGRVPNEVGFGAPGMATAKEIIRRYYL